MEFGHKWVFSQFPHWICPVLLIVKVSVLAKEVKNLSLDSSQEKSKMSIYGISAEPMSRDDMDRIFGHTRT